MGNENEKISVITEVGDLGIGVDELDEKDQEAYRKTKKNENH
jgi:hypothetical protein